MTPSAASAKAFTARDAATTLEGLGAYEEGLTTRAAALSWMFFGLAGAAIFPTYEAAVPYFEASGQPWWLGLLWIPWIAAAATLTNLTWRLLSVTLDVGYSEKETLVGTLGGTLLFFALGAILYAVGRFTALEVTLGASTGWAMVVGAFTAVLAIYQSRRYGAAVLLVPFLLAGLVLFVAGAIMTIWTPPGPLAGLIAAGIEVGAYFVAGTYVYRKG